MNDREYKAKKWTFIKNSRTFMLERRKSPRCVPKATLKSFIDNLLSSLFKINVSSYLYSLLSGVRWMASFRRDFPFFYCRSELFLLLLFALGNGSRGAAQIPIHSPHWSRSTRTLALLFILNTSYTLSLCWPDKTIRSASVIIDFRLRI